MLPATRSLGDIVSGEEVSFASKIQQVLSAGGDFPLCYKAFVASLRKKWTAAAMVQMRRERQLLDASEKTQKTLEDEKASWRADVAEFGLKRCALPSCDKLEASVQQYCRLQKSGDTTDALLRDNCLCSHRQLCDCQQTTVCALTDNCLFVDKQLFACRQTTVSSLTDNCLSSHRQLSDCQQTVVCLSTDSCVLSQTSRKRAQRVLTLQRAPTRSRSRRRGALWTTATGPRYVVRQRACKGIACAVGPVSLLFQRAFGLYHLRETTSGLPPRAANALDTKR